MIVRVSQLEERFGIEDMNIYAYLDGTSLKVVGEIIAEEIKAGFKLMCSVFDQENDMVEAEENQAYGSGFVTSVIAKNSFYDGFPFAFSIYLKENCKISRIQILPV